jgi:hypothetical protein
MLVQLIQEVCQYPFNSPQRRKIMNQLLLELQKLPNLGKSKHPDYLDALNKTWLWVNQNICEQFNLNLDLVEKRLTTWINSTLYWRIKDLYKLEANPKIPLDKYIGEQELTTFLDQLSETGMTTPTHTGLDQLIEEIEQQEKQNISDKIEQYINEDPEQILINCHPKNNPEANCKILCQRLLLQDPPDKMSHIAKELNINNQTLNSHFKRNCLKHLQNIAKQLGYNHE